MASDMNFPRLTFWEFLENALHSFILFFSFISLAQGLVNFFCKGPGINVPGFAHHVISVTITQFCYCCLEAAIDTHTGLSVALFQ